MKTVLIAICMMIGSAVATTAAPISWTFSGNDLGQVSGGFDYDPTTGLFSNASVAYTPSASVASILTSQGLSPGAGYAASTIAVSTANSLILSDGFSAVNDARFYFGFLAGTFGTLGTVSDVVNVNFGFCRDVGLGACSVTGASPLQDSIVFTGVATVAPVPLPAGVALLLTALGGLGLLRRRTA